MHCRNSPKAGILKRPVNGMTENFRRNSLPSDLEGVIFHQHEFSPINSRFNDRCALSVPAAKERQDVFASIDTDTTKMFDAIAGKIERQPDLLEIPLNNIVRWLAQGHPSTARLNAWKSRIESAASSSSEFAELLCLLRDSSPEAYPSNLAPLIVDLGLTGMVPLRPPGIL